MIGSQTLTRHVLFTCVLFIWFQLWLLAFVHQEPEELLKRGNRWVSWRKAYRPILQKLTHFYQPNICVSAVILARNSLQKPKDFSFGILYRTYIGYRFKFQSRVTFVASQIHAPHLTQQRCGTWLKLTVCTVEKDWVDPDPVKSLTECCQTQTIQHAHGNAPFENRWFRAVFQNKATWERFYKSH